MQCVEELTLTYLSDWVAGRKSTDMMLYKIQVGKKRSVKERIR